MEYPLNFTTAMHFIKLTEGGTNNDPVDRGGLTKFGICQKTYPDMDIVKLTYDDAVQIYYDDFWQFIKGDAFGATLSIILMDSAVNCGRSSATRWLQKVCNDLGGTLRVDGLLGPVSLREIGHHNRAELIMGIVGRRLDRYGNLIIKHPEQKKYIAGWILRVSRLITFLLHH